MGSDWSYSNGTEINKHRKREKTLQLRKDKLNAASTEHNFKIPSMKMIFPQIVGGVGAQS